MAEAVQAAGKIVGGVASYEAGKYNRAAARSEAISAEREGAAEEARIREAARFQMGAQQAAQAENGFQPGTGSALDALQESAINATMDALTARRQAQAKARSLRASGAVAYAAGKNGLVQGLMGAASTGVDWASSRQGTSPSGGSGSGGGSSAIVVNQNAIARASEQGYSYGG